MSPPSSCAPIAYVVMGYWPVAYAVGARGSPRLVRLRKLSVSVGSSLWFLPVMCVLAGAAISFVTIALDRVFDYQAIPQG